MDSRSLSIVVPLLNEQKTLPSLVSHLSYISADEVILVDGGSSDDTVSWLHKKVLPRFSSWKLLQTHPGRAIQMNGGAQLAQGDMLLFLHADTQLPKTAKTEISQARDKNYFWGRFDVEFHPTSKIDSAMRIIALFMNIRSRLTSIATGDQALFVDRALFLSLGGFPTIPLMEDVAFSKNLKQHGVPYCSQLKVKTSARRWQQNGVVQTVLQMWWLRLAYFCGVSPLQLSKWYRTTR